MRAGFHVAWLLGAWLSASVAIAQTPDERSIEDAPHDVGAPTAEADAERAHGDARARRARRHVLHNTWLGTVGGVRVADAGSGAAGAFRVQLALGFFAVDGWLAPTASDLDFAGSLAVSWTPFDHLEIYTSLSSSHHESGGASVRFPGDTYLGVKAFTALVPWVLVGADAQINFRNLFGDAALFLETFSVGLRASLSADLRELPDRAIPLIARLNVGYRFDASPAIVAADEAARYDALPTTGPDARRPLDQEDRHLIGRAERYALRIDRVDPLTLGIGIEAPISLADVTLSPILEWVLQIPVNRHGAPCAPPNDPGADRCLATEGFAAYRQSLTLGLRVAPPVIGMSILAAAEIGLTGVHSHVRELAAQEPYRVIVGLAYAYDTTIPH